MRAVLLLSLLLMFAASGLAAQTSKDKGLAELRRDFAVRYLQPDAHFALAKYYIDHGQPVQAFYILEYARRYRFDGADFSKAHVSFFGDPMPEPPDEAKRLFEAASNLVTQKKYDEAEVQFKKAYVRDNRSLFINAWIGRFYYKTRSDSSSALPYYFKSYFLYPDAYETEYVESRIRSITLTDADRTFAERRKNGAALPQLASDADPLIVMNALKEISKAWSPEHLAILQQMLSNDDSLVRWGAFATLRKYSGESWKSIVDGLQASVDLRKRGLSAYAIAEWTGPEKFDVLKKMLASDAEIVRFDAASALIMAGGETAKQILTQYQSTEKQPRLKALVAKALASSAK